MNDEIASFYLLVVEGTCIKWIKCLSVKLYFILYFSYQYFQSDFV